MGWVPTSPGTHGWAQQEGAGRGGIDARQVRAGRQEPGQDGCRQAVTTGGCLPSGWWDLELTPQGHIRGKVGVRQRGHSRSQLRAGSQFRGGRAFWTRCEKRLKTGACPHLWPGPGTSLNRLFAQHVSVRGHFLLRLQEAEGPP